MGGTKRAGLIVAAIVLLAGFTVPVAADHLPAATGQPYNCLAGVNGGNNVTENASWVWFYDTLEDDTEDALEWARWNRYDPRPQLSVTLNSSYTWTTDAWVEDNVWEPYCGVDFTTVGALTMCVDVNTAGECEQHHILFDLRSIGAVPDNETYDRHIACHELGHGLGMNHDVTLPYGCMRFEAGVFPTDLHDHDLASIDFAYPYDQNRSFNWVGAVANADPDMTDRTGNKLDVVVRSTGNGIWHLPYNGSAWQAPANLGGSAVGGPSIASWNNTTRLDVVIRGTNGALWQNATDGAGWYGWSSPGGILTSDPDITAPYAGRFDVVARGADGAAYHIYYQGGWSSWEPLGGTVLAGTGPSIVATPDGRFHVVVTSTNGQLYYKQWTGSAWGSWYAVGGQYTSSPDLAALGTRIDVIGRGLDGAMYHSYRPAGGSWAPFDIAGGTPDGGPTATWRDASKYDVIARGDDDYTYYGYWSGTW